MRLSPIVAVVLTTTFGAFFVLPSSAVSKGIKSSSKQQQTALLLAADRVVGEAKNRKVRVVGQRGVVSISAPGTSRDPGRPATPAQPASESQPEVAADSGEPGTYFITVKPRKGRAVIKVRLKTRGGSYRLARVKKAGGSIRFRAVPGSPYPYREVRVWTKRVNKASSINPGKGTSDEPKSSGQRGLNCTTPYQVEFLFGAWNSTGDTEKIKLTGETTGQSDGVYTLYSWEPRVPSVVICRAEVVRSDGSKWVSTNPEGDSFDELVLTDGSTPPIRSLKVFAREKLK